jgi:Cytochrome P460
VRRLLLLGSSAVVLSACGGGTDPVSQPTSSEARDDPTTERETTTAAGTTTEDAPPPAPPAEAPPGIPGFVGGYRDWTRLNDAPIPPRPSDPHNGTKNVYASKERRPSGRFPAGTIVVKEATRPGVDFIGLIAVMRKERGADPAHGDWVFVEYTRDAGKERFREAASGAVCWSCHMGAVDSDYVFTE